jgi:hypothetical protein
MSLGKRKPKEHIIKWRSDGSFWKDLRKLDFCFECEGFGDAQIFGDLVCWACNGTGSFAVMKRLEKLKSFE